MEYYTLAEKLTLGLAWIDPRTGEKEQLLGFNKVKNTCPVEMQDIVFVGRTEYNIIMVDSKRKNRKWNVTFYDYSAAKMEPEGIENYGWLLFFFGYYTFIRVLFFRC